MYCCGLGLPGIGLEVLVGVEFGTVEDACVKGVRDSIKLSVNIKNFIEVMR
ncbi:hypothetical protein [Rickettsiales endosymbiont of Peranema trichophorum]|uniref:hypothetical protein n=1 Tax=Rickettsiales endosymbiont of Peranema trichophorum TaxID=2486577 RepID=UPI0013EE449E|nr:hypothetical protein [Rickettsiales endosymbiont of Peranema trichophorum]